MTMNDHLHPVMREALNAHLEDDDGQPESGWWRCAICGQWSAPTWNHCENGHDHPYLDGGPE